MAKIKIPRSFRKTLRNSIKADGGEVANKKKDLRDTKRTMRTMQNSGEIKRSKITWNISVGDLVKIKSKKANPTYGIVTYKKQKVNYSNQEEDYVILMTPSDSQIKISPKSLEIIQEIEKESN